MLDDPAEFVSQAKGVDFSKLVQAHHKTACGSSWCKFRFCGVEGFRMIRFMDI